MKVKLKIEKEFEVKYLLAEVGARYWEDATVNGEEDAEGTLIPCRDGEYWKPLIDIETGIIINWDKGHTASIHYKCCDNGLYKLLDENKNEIKSIEGYVPKLCVQKKTDTGIMSLWILTVMAKLKIGKLICRTFKMMMSSRPKMAYNSRIGATTIFI